MKFSIIIPNYNSEKYIEKCIKSILNQTYKNYEIIIIDDISTDNSVEIIKKILKKPHKLIINKTKRLSGGTRNVGIAEATGEYIIQIDSDDWFIDNKVLEDINKYLINNPVDVLYLGYKMQGADENSVILNINNQEEALNTLFGAGWLKCVKIDKYKQALFPEGTLFEDRIENYELATKCNTFGSLGRITHIWNRKNENATTFNPKWCWYRFDYCGELYRLIQQVKDKETKDILIKELKLYQIYCNEMVDEL